MTNVYVPARFKGGKDVVVGQVRLPYVPATAKYPEGWALPGRGTTTDQAVAYEVAIELNKMLPRSTTPKRDHREQAP